MGVTLGYLEAHQHRCSACFDVLLAGDTKKHQHHGMSTRSALHTISYVLESKRWAQELISEVRSPQWYGPNQTIILLSEQHDHLHSEIHEGRVQQQHTKLENYTLKDLTEALEDVKEALRSPQVKAILNHYLRGGRAKYDTPCIVAWHTTLDTLMTRRLSRYTSSGLTTWDARSVHDGESTWVVVPGHVAEDLKDLTDIKPYHPENAQVMLTPAPEKTILETAIGLWEPHGSRGVLRDITEAVKAARHIHQ